MQHTILSDRRFCGMVLAGLSSLTAWGRARSGALQVDKMIFTGPVFAAKHAIY
jgi:hypothetical protein